MEPFEPIGVLPYDCTVAELISLLEELPDDALITPFGESNCAICYDPNTNCAYMDNLDYLEDTYGEFGPEGFNRI